jgi:hypothetical protein
MSSRATGSDACACRLEPSWVLGRSGEARAGCRKERPRLQEGEAQDPPEEGRGAHGGAISTSPYIKQDNFIWEHALSCILIGTKIAVSSSAVQTT